MSEERASYPVYTSEHKKYFKDVLRLGGMMEKWAVSEIERLEAENRRLREIELRLRQYIREHSKTGEVPSL